VEAYLPQYQHQTKRKEMNRILSGILRFAGLFFYVSTIGAIGMFIQELNSNDFDFNGEQFIDYLFSMNGSGFFPEDKMATAVQMGLVTFIIGWLLMRGSRALGRPSCSVPAVKKDRTREFKVTCPHCKQSLEAPEDLLGSVVDCPACNKSLQLPRADVVGRV